MQRLSAVRTSQGTSGHGNVLFLQRYSTSFQRAAVSWEDARAGCEEVATIGKGTFAPCPKHIGTPQRVLNTPKNSKYPKKSYKEGRRCSAITGCLLPV